MWTANFVEDDGASMVPLNGSLCERREDQIGTLNGSSHIAEAELAVPTL